MRNYFGFSCFLLFFILPACHQESANHVFSQSSVNSNSHETYPRQGSLTGKFVIIDKFVMPQLEKQRRIWIYLPLAFQV